MDVIQVRNLVKTFPTKEGLLTAVNNISFNIKNLEAVKLLGFVEENKKVENPALNLIIKEAVKIAKQNVPHTIKIEVETENLSQVIEAVDSGADIIMFDNMPVEEMKKAVEMINGKSITEASGTITLETINLIASTDVDYISTSAITAKAGIIDIGLDI